MNPAKNDYHKVVSNTEWLEARLDLLAKEKQFTRLRDELSQARRNLPWERVSKSYMFDGPNGKASLADIFEGRRQLIVYRVKLLLRWGLGKDLPNDMFLQDSD
jgi:predicted dithiol-disulfide oxidoreductase (DUF899 family)